MKKIYFFFSFLFFTTAGSISQSIPSWKITDVVNYTNQKTDSIYVINFWATWCRPCVEEMPHLLNITKKYAGKKVKLLLVSLDFASAYPAKIAAFARQKKITAQKVWLNETDADYFCSMIDKSWSGSIPATLIVNAATGYRQFYEQGFTKEEFETALKKAFD